MIKITINTDNEAFQGVTERYEVARILRVLADKVEVYDIDDYSLFDSNGNKVGKCEIK